MRVLVACVGNIFCSDDGFGVTVARELLERGGLPEGVEVVDTGIRGMHLAYQLLDGYDALILIDTVHRDGPPGTIYRLEHDLDAPAVDAVTPGPDAHGMDPGTVLALLAELAAANGLAQPVRRVLIVGCEPAELSEGMGLSEPVAAAVELAVRTVDDLLALLSETTPEGTRS